MLCLILLTAIAKDAPDAIQIAEADRLSHQMETYAERQAWKAVERGYVKAVATTAPLKAEIHQLGAHAARDRGDITLVEQRLQAALAAESTGEVIEELWAITQAYGRVDLQGKALIPTKTPFDPVQARALALAQEQLLNTGAYQGLLPRGTYVLDGVVFRLLLGRPPVELISPLAARTMSEAAPPR